MSLSTIARRIAIGCGVIVLLPTVTAVTAHAAAEHGRQIAHRLPTSNPGWTARAMAATGTGDVWAAGG